MSDPDLDELAEQLSDFAAPERKGGRPPREERIIAGFEEIQRFVSQHGHVPLHGEGRDIFERLYAVRLDRLRALDECRTLLEPFDSQGLLRAGEVTPVESAEAMTDDELLSELEGSIGSSDITKLRNVRSQAEIRAAEEIAERERCNDFARFQPEFERAERELKSGVRQTRPFGKDASIEAGNFFILGGQLVYVAEVGETIKAPNGENDARLRVIYSNGTESNLLRRSLQRALYKDEAGRRLTEAGAGPLFSETKEEDDAESGTIYVLRSKSDNPLVWANRDVLHKIGVTGGKVEARLANASLDPTFLMADVDVVATYVLYNINRVKLENLIHRVFGSAQLDIEIKDRFGNPVKPREWFLVPLFVIDEVVNRIKDGTISGYAYDPRSASLKQIVS